MTTDVSDFYQNGCGRCKHYATPNCKVNLWSNELLYLRGVALSAGLTEVIKWGMPCFIFEKKNIVMIAPFKNNCVISFFKGALVNNNRDILKKAGENSEYSRIIRFTKISEIINIEEKINEIIAEAIEIEKKGIKSKKAIVTLSHYPSELLEKFNESPELESAFKKMTPGRQRSYIIYFISAKQSSTRIARIEKQISSILNGKGFNEK